MISFCILMSEKGINFRLQSSHRPSLSLSLSISPKQKRRNVSSQSSSPSSSSSLKLPATSESKKERDFWRVGLCFRYRDGRCDFFNGGEVSVLPAESTFLQDYQRRSNGASADGPISPPRKRRRFASSHAPRQRDRGHVRQVPYGRHDASVFSRKRC